MRWRGYLWALGSVLLASVAQLLMKLGMIVLPAVAWSYFSLTFLQQHAVALLGVSLGILGYACSMVCWLLALRDIPLNRAYPLLSLSYVLVYLATVALPWFQESVSWNKNLGVIVILFGVWLISGGKKRDV